MHSDQLEDWSALRASVAINELLMGNGASLAVWRNFAYFSLFDEAQAVQNRPLSPTELSVFRALDSNLFEQALSALRKSIRVNAALTINSSSPRHRYFAIKEALIHAVRRVHIPWSQMPIEQLRLINQELRQYQSVYSTNYDLLAYWAVLQTPDAFDSQFNAPDNTFDPTQTQRLTDKTRMHYLHGGMHLVKNSDGSTRQLHSSESTLLASFAINQLGDIPLFVNEDTSSNKLRAIRGSDYLSHCYQQLAHAKSALAIFGHRLDPQDQHLVHAIGQAQPAILAISIYPHNSAFIDQQKHYYNELFGHLNSELRFYNALSHPLGSPALKVTTTELT